MLTHLLGRSTQDTICAPSNKMTEEAAASTRACVGFVDEPNPPNWPSSVIVIHTKMSRKNIMELIQPTSDSITKNAHVAGSKPGDESYEEVVYNSGKHFVDDRYAVLFAPGTYENVDFQVGYYTQVLGLGSHADDVTFTNCEYGPYCPALHKEKLVGGVPGLSLDTFWRAAENYATEARHGQLWAVSQAAPIRRVHVKKRSGVEGDGSGHLKLHDNGAQASGGHSANCIVDGMVDFGSQQQWCCRNVEMGDGHGYAAWSNVFVGCKGLSHTKSQLLEVDGRTVAWTVDETPNVVVEKPFVVLQNDGRYCLHVPQPKTGEHARGSDLTGDTDDARDFSKVYVARANTSSEGDETDTDVASKINKALREGKDVVLSPGIYVLNSSLDMTRDSQVLLGLGLATLVAPTDGSPCIRVAHGVDGVRVAGIMLEASKLEKRNETEVASLIEWGQEGNPYPGNPLKPGVMTDVFARVGGSSLDRFVSTDVMIRIHSGNVYGDNLWLWRADHVALIESEGEMPNFPPLDYHQVTLGEVPCRTGLEVHGDDVTIHGLAVEHTTQDQVVWHGRRGNVQFYQSELPYDVTSEYGQAGHVGYRVKASAMDHVACGVGVYSNFRDHSVPVKTAVHHAVDCAQIVNPFTKYLDNKGLIETVVNGQGGPAKEGEPPSFLVDVEP